MHLKDDNTLKRSVTHVKVTLGIRNGLQSPVNVEGNIVFRAMACEGRSPVVVAHSCYTQRRKVDHKTEIDFLPSRCGQWTREYDVQRAHAPWLENAVTS